MNLKDLVAEPEFTPGRIVFVNHESSPWSDGPEFMYYMVSETISFLLHSTRLWGPGFCNQRTRSGLPSVLLP